jgi:ABC-type phosphate transport system permease subunit
MKLAGYDRYFLMVDVSGLLFATWAVGWTVRGAADWVTLLGAVWLISLLVLFSRKRRDEFAEHCWRRATSATFGMLLIAPLLVTVIGLMAEGFMAEHARDSGLARTPVRPEDFEPSLGAILILLFGTFFLSFEWTRFRGGPA